MFRAYFIRVLVQLHERWPAYRCPTSTFELDFLIRHFDVSAYATLLSARHSPACQLYGLRLRELENPALLYPGRSNAKIKLKITRGGEVVERDFD
jgi:hypothetical protein